MLLAMRHDLRAPPSGSASTAEVYDTALEQIRWADEQGWDLVALSEHHGLDDGWMPAPLTMAAAAAGATRRITILVSAVIAPLHDPVRLAEQLTVLDHVSRGRVWTVLGAGYRDDEFVMAGVDRRRRGRLVEEHARVLLQAWTGEPFDWRGRTVRVTPVPRTRPHPMLLVGGGVEAAARRAARLRLPMLPMSTDPRVAAAYGAEAERIGFEGGFVLNPLGPTFVHVTEDPERTWAQIGPHLLHEARTYASFQAPGQVSTPLVHAETVEDLKASPQIVVGPPDAVLARLRALPTGAAATFNPLAGGLPAELAWASLELFAAEVAPRLTRG